MTFFIKRQAVRIHAYQLTWLVPIIGVLCMGLLLML